jgi:hypothetical protein
VNSDPVMLGGAAASGDNWAAFVSNVDIEAVFEAIHNRAPLTPEHVRRTAVVLVCYGSNSYRAYATEVTRIPELSLHPGIFASPPERTQMAIT